MLVTYEKLRTAGEIARLNGGKREQYRIELYKRYTGKDPAKIVYNGFKVTRPDGTTSYYTIHYRTDNLKPYAIYLNGSQTAQNTYISRGQCVRTLDRLRVAIAKNRPADKIELLHGSEIIA